MPPLVSRRRIRLLALLVALGLAQAIAAVGGAACVRTLFDALGDRHSGSQPLSPWTLGLLASVVAVAVLDAVQRSGAEVLALDYTSEVRLGLFDHLSRVPADRLTRRSHGGLLLPFVGDLSALRLWAGQGLARLVVGSVMTAGLMAALFLASPPVALACAAVLATGATATMFLGPPLERAVRQVRRRRASLAALISSRLAALATLQALGAGHRERARVVRRNRAMNLAAVRRASLVGGLRGLSQLTSGLMAAAVLIAGGAVLSSGQLSLGGIAAATGLVSLMAAPVYDLGRAFELWRPAKVSAEKIRALLNEPLRAAAPARETRRGGAPLVFESVRTRPDGPVINAKLRRGAVALLIGRAGSGKTEVANLAAGLGEADEGQVRIKGRDLATLTPSRRRQLIGFASPAAPLVRGSLRLNLTYRRPDATAGELEEAITISGVDRLVRRLPEGLDTQISEAGANLSGGERQAVILARALLGAPHLLVIDSIDSALDPVVVRRLAGRLAEWAGGVLLIARNPDLIDVATETWALGRNGLVTRRIRSKSILEAAQ